jgi:hypothetical protein
VRITPPPPFQKRWLILSEIVTYFEQENAKGYTSRKERAEPHSVKTNTYNILDELFP